jgi:L-iditol 2-dehydrogenase
MKVGMYYKNNDVRVEELILNSNIDNSIVIKVMSSGICGSDLMEWYRIKSAPRVLGHEVTGEVTKVIGPNTYHNLGDRVFVTHHVPCDNCKACFNGNETACPEFHGINNFNPGGFSEYLNVSGKSVRTGTLKLPDNVSYDEGTFIEPIGTVVRGLRKIDFKPANDIIVYGAGMAGQLFIKTAKAFGARNITALDINQDRLAIAKNNGADFIINNRGMDPPIKADNVIITTGNREVCQQALDKVERGGTLLYFAVPKPEETLDLNLNPFWRNDISIKTSYGAGPKDNSQALDLLSSKRIEVNDMITHTLPLEQIAEGFRIAEKGEGMKVIIKPHFNQYPK